ncbi:MAG: DUF1045 domain-containing protein [Pseudorhodobacter sp.]|nr:DUF1045 domain-containing protein [Pseudorhodobacter sp.]
MEQMKRYAVYYAPEAGPFATAGARWLGWDPATGRSVPQPELGLDLAAFTTDPRKYGFHGTLKPPFRLAAGVTQADLSASVATLARQLSAVGTPDLQFVDLEGFLALTPHGDNTALTALAAEVVAQLDPFRAPLSEVEIARRRPERLSPRQRELLDRYGYPHVMEEFRFHLTLSNALTTAEHARLRPLAEAHFTPHLPQPFRLKDLCLFGEAADGRLHLLHRYPLT